MKKLLSHVAEFVTLIRTGGFRLAAMFILIASAAPANASGPSSVSICDDPAYRGTPEYNKYCGGSSGSSSGGAPSGGGFTPQQQMILNGTQMLTPLLHDALYGNPEENARKAQQEAIAAEQRKRREEERKVELLRQQELTKQRILARLKGVEPSSGLALKMGDSEPPPDRHENKLKLSDTNNKKHNSDAYTKGFNDASGCYSQNAGPHCINASADQQQACMADYNAGFELGDKQREIVMHEAYQTGQKAGTNGELANGAADPRAKGPCSTQWIEAYNRGYFKGKHAGAQH